MGQSREDRQGLWRCLYGSSYNRQEKNTGKVDFSQFLSGIPAKDYIFQDAVYEEQIKAASSLLSVADAVVVGVGAGLSAAAGLVPKCPVCGGNMAMHLRCDQYFVEDEHWHETAGHYASFLEEHGKDRVVLLELGVGFNTPTIIRFPFERMVRRNENWSLIRLNLEEAFVPGSFGKRAVGIGADIAKSICDITKGVEENEAK